MLADAKIQVHAQVVLCPGYNDGEVLSQTVRELAELHPEARGTYGGVLSVAIVPVGLTQFRDRLAALTNCGPEFCAKLVNEVDTWRKRYKKALGTNFVFLSDEFYLNAGVTVPRANDYEGFPQLEDGVGWFGCFSTMPRKSRANCLPRSPVDGPQRWSRGTGEPVFGRFCGPVEPCGKRRRQRLHGP